MSATLQLQTDATVADPSAPSSAVDYAIADAVATSHDYVDATPRNVATAGNPGTAFVLLPTAVVHIERFLASVPLGAALVLRFGGAVATVLGSVAGVIAPGGGNPTLVLGVDGAPSATAIFAATDTSIQLAANRINGALASAGLSAVVAIVDPITGGLRLTGLKTGGADAQAKAFSFGAIALSATSTGLALLGLTAGTTYGAGDDQYVGAGLFAKTFPPSNLPAQLELSGTATNLKTWTAGRAT